MQKKIQFFHLILFMPVLFWLVAKPISLVKADDSQVKTEKHQKTFQVAEQHVYQVSSSTNVDFPQDFVFPSVQIFSAKAPQLAIKLPSVIHRTQFMRILLTQFIATLAPWKTVVSDQLSVVRSRLSNVQRLTFNVQRPIEYLQFIIYHLI